MECLNFCVCWYKLCNKLVGLYISLYKEFNELFHVKILNNSTALPGIFA